METAEQNTLLNELESVLIEERETLLEGRLSALSEIGDRKSLLAGSLEIKAQSQPAPELQDLLSRVGELAQRNSELMSEANDALRGSLQRLKELQKIAAGEDTYQRDGSRRFDSVASATMQKRA